MSGNVAETAEKNVTDKQAKPVLSIRQLQMRFGGLVAVDNITFDVIEKEIYAIIGPNGAGKTTVFNCISGFYKPTSGGIMFGGADIAGRASHEIARCGIVRTFQNIRLFRNMTVVENLLVAQHAQLKTGLLHGLLNTRAYRKSEREALERAAFWLDRVRLREVANREAGNLSYGQQRRLEIARCMITQPKLLMLDEPAAGLNPQETVELDQLIRDLRDTCNVSVLLIEHDMSLVMEISDRILVMEYGQPIAEGTPEQVRHDPNVIRAYLGGE
ncbi:MAG: high-affinity branched-chain amino acid ABC transporter ATP-binding protein LivG [Burkholderiales bacterium]|jgi:branched-chain amino acid transport system ATP-binding protein|nr:high-affinity branched-chain amino acid ABC transporter ATP-binding protein LivG [Burkholderiales bacterium]